MEADIERFETENHQDDEASQREGLLEDCEMSEFNEDEENDDDDDEEGENERYYPNVPVIYPRARYAGACNVETVKDGESNSTIS